MCLVQREYSLRPKIKDVLDLDELRNVKVLCIENKMERDRDVLEKEKGVLKEENGALKSECPVFWDKI
jgi:hypothetical protein